MKTKLFAIIAVFAFSIGLAAQTRDLAKWVNPFIGTGGHGHTFPGATMPFGMVQLSPDTRIDNWDGSSGYHYSDDTIYGFSHTHLNGTGIPDYCDVLFMPQTGAVRFADAVALSGGSKFSHANEHAEPGYYSVRLDDGNILAELTARTRVGFHRYTFPRSDSGANILIDLKWRDRVLDSELKVVGDRRIEGYRRSSSWAKDQAIYFVAEFSRPFDFPLIGNSGSITSGGGKGDRLRGVLHFDTTKSQQVLVKVAISHVSIEGARKNLAAELPGWDFEKVRADAKAAWNKELSKIEVSGGTDDQTTTFYTALYHTMIQPNIFNDVDGSYLGMDKKVHSLSQVRKLGPERTARGAKSDRGVAPTGTKKEASGDQYTIFSLWDTFRAAHPLYTIIDQKRTVDFINTFIRQYEQGGRLPVWELAANETDCMIGYHSVSVIADAMAKGLTGFDYEKAYAAAKHSAELDHFGLAGYKKRGYISMEDENESVSRTMEYAYDDWCIAQMAKVLMYRESKPSKNGPKPSYDPKTGIASFPIDVEKTKYLNEYRQYLKRGRYFENLFDPKIGFFRPKKNGGFVEPFAPNEVTFGFTEGNSWQYSFFVPQDVEHLVKLHGGREKFTAKLDELFNTDQKLGGREQADLTGLIGQYAHGNEPSHHITYLYDYIGQPWKTQKLVRRIMDEFYHPAPDGLIGNEDCGQMSAWYIMSASGFYQVAPGKAEYAFGTPLFPEMKYRLENGKTFTIRAKGVSAKNFYIQSATLNGVPHKKAFLTHADLMKGGVLEFSMTDAPAMGAFSEFPVSSIGGQTVSVPVINGERTIKDKVEVSISTATPDVKIYYTTNGDEPVIGKSDVYERSFSLDHTTTVKAIAAGSTGDPSKPVSALFIKRPNDWSVKVMSKYSSQYTGGGDNAIIDGIRGTVNFASGEWQGVQGKTYEAVIDMQRETPVSEVGASFLQVALPWIWMPDRVEFEASTDGKTFTKIAEIKPGFPQTDLTPTASEYRQAVTPTKARYIRMRAYNFGKIPSWHLGAGGDPWIFVDEVFIR
ncbi:MAG TPA: GH92 family glycosyl hydrolase [Pyrinomonadaceae bacterium]|nr:GH92 family glycosyl hydrolase [Pyrinomonadaceae bacterium]